MNKNVLEKLILERLKFDKPSGEGIYDIVDALIRICKCFYPNIDELSVQSQVFGLISKLAGSGKIRKFGYAPYSGCYPHNTQSVWGI